MTSPNPFRLAVLTAVILPMCSVSAQGCFDAVPGVALGFGDEDVSAPLALGFPFAWPDGTVDASAIVTSNGRVVPGSAAVAATFNVSPARFLQGPPTVAALWTDLDFGEPNAGDVEFYADPSAVFATFTFRDAVLFNGGDPFTYQVRLDADGGFSFRFDARAASALGPSTVAVIGFTEGGATTNDPGSSDLSTALGGTLDSGTVPTGYESFFLAPFDLDATDIAIDPNGLGGYVTAVGVCADLPSVLDLGGGCNRLPPPDSAVVVLWEPDGMGGLVSTIDPVGLAFDPDLGASIGADIDTVTAVDLGFPFTMPGGTVVTGVRIDSNGRVVLPTSASVSVFDPSVAELEVEEQIAVLWCDWVTELGGGGGSIHFTTDPVAGVARITWNETEAFTVTPPSDTVGTFQLQLFGGAHPRADSWAACYQRTNVDPSSSSLAIGASDGVAGASNLDIYPSGAVSSSGSHWQHFDSTVPDPWDVQPSAPGGSERMSLEVLSGMPRIGGSFDLILERAPPAASLGGIAFGFTRLDLPLGIVSPGNPCSLGSSTDLLIPLSGGASTQFTTLDLSAGDATLLGFRFELQGLFADLSLPYAIPVVTSNTLEITVGS